MDKPKTHTPKTDAPKADTPKMTWTQLQAAQREASKAQQDAAQREAEQQRLAGAGGRPVAPEGRADRAARGRQSQRIGEAVEGMLKAHVAPYPHAGRLDKIPTPVQIKRNLGPNASKGGAIEVYGELRPPVAPDFLGHWMTAQGLLPLAIEAKAAQDTEAHARRWAIPDKLRIHTRPLEGLVGRDGQVGRQAGEQASGAQEARAQKEASKRAALRALLDGVQADHARRDGHQGLYLEDLGAKGGVAAVFLWRESTRAQYLVPVDPQRPHIPSLRASSWAWDELGAWEVPPRASIADALSSWARYKVGGWAGLV